MAAPRSAALTADASLCLHAHRFAAQRALTRNGEQLSNSLIIGVKPLDPRHKAAVEAYTSGPDSPGQLVRPKLLPERPYKVDLTQAQRVPQASRSVVSKVMEFVFGV